MEQLLGAERFPQDIEASSLVDLTPMTVLHVDDDPGITEVTAAFLERENSDFEVLTDTSASGALDQLADEATSIDCIVSDYDMPGMNGIEFLETVRERRPSLPFILFTGKGSEQVAGRAISAGVTDYLQKESGTDHYTVLANRIENSVKKTRAEQHTQQLLSAIETAREGISLLNEDGRFVYVNQAYADTYGYDPERLLGEHWELLYPDDDVTRVTEDVLPNIPDEGVLREETRMTRKDGSEIVTDHALSYTPEGLMVCNIRTLSKEMDNNGLLSDVLDGLDDLLFFFDEDGTLQFWNEQVEKVTGYDADELPSRTPTDLVHEDDRERVDEHVQETRESGHSRVEVQLQQADGETVPYEFISKRVENGRGAVIGRIGVGRDISERKQYESQFERQNERLEHFAEILSHDLRNPLTVANIHLGLLQETGETEHYETAQTALDRMERLITDILELAQDGDLIHRAEYETAELERVAESAWQMIRKEAASLEVVDSAPVESDVSRLQQLLENLFRNAVEHGESDVSVRIGLLADENGLYVEDDGPGIPPEEHEKVFEAGHSTKHDGTGFGLATVEQLVEGHGWEIRITDGTTGGARFEITGMDFDSR